MRKLDVFIVRILPFILFALFVINVLCCICGIDITDSYNLHGNSFPYALGFFLVSLSNKKYHCVYNRAMYVFLMVVPIINYIDAKFTLFKTSESYVWFVVCSLILTLLVTAYLAIRHFVQGAIKRYKKGAQ